VKIQNNGNGTGFIISANGYILTNEHVASKTQGRNAYYSMAKTDNMHKLEIITSSKKLDVSLCRFNPSDVPGFTVVKRVKDYTKVQPGVQIVIIGNGLSMGLAPMMGNIKFASDPSTGDLIHSAPTNQGDSGSPVFNSAGECIGIHKSRTATGRNVSNATPMNEIDRLLNKWTKEHEIVL
jgi:serine protease Do